MRDRININEKGEILKTDSETAKTLNSFFSNIVKNLNIWRYSECHPVTENIADPTLKAIFKFKDHPSALAIQSNCEKETFCFSEVNINPFHAKGFLMFSGGVERDQWYEMGVVCFGFFSQT